jgi:hypothetical protein
MQNEEKKGEFISDIVGKISNAKDEDYTEGMPTFDLGSQILAQHRKIAAMKRKSPGSSASAPAHTTTPVAIEKVQAKKPVPIQIKSFHAMVEQPMSPQQRIIADIIAREIRVLTATAR